MRLISVTIALILGFLFSFCNDSGLENPHYPAEPSITFKKIEFIETASLAEFDTLNLVIRYRDGDSDLGFDILDPTFSKYPYNSSWYFLADGTSYMSRVTTESVFLDGFTHYDLLKLNSNATGKLVIDKTRNQPNYGYLPSYDPNSCINYSFTEVLVAEDDNVIDASFNVIDTLEDGLANKYFLVEEPLLYSLNENYYNILVEFYFSNDGVNFIEYDWFKEFCIDFNGRFPLLGDYTGKISSGPFKIKAITPWEGEIRYSIPNSSFLAIFGSKKIKLKIKIKDLALNTSNEIETTAFTLDEIRKD